MATYNVSVTATVHSLASVVAIGGNAGYATDQSLTSDTAVATAVLFATASDTVNTSDAATVPRQPVNAKNQVLTSDRATTGSPGHGQRPGLGQGQGLLGQALLGQIRTGQNPRPVELGRAVLGGSWLTGWERLLVAPRATDTVLTSDTAIASGQHYPVLPQKGLLGADTLGQTRLGGIQRPFVLGRLVLGWVTLGGDQSAASGKPTVVETVLTSDSAGVTRQIVHASDTCLTSDSPVAQEGYDVCYWMGLYGQGGNQENPPGQATPALVPNMGSQGTGRVQTLDWENGFGYVVIAGVIWGFGDNSEKQLSPATTGNTPITTPVNVSSLQDLPNPVIQVDGGDRFGMVVDTAGEVWCWGSNGHDNVGNGTSSSPVSPAVQTSGVGGVGELVALTQYGAVTSAGGSALAIQPPGAVVPGKTTVVAWGANNNGQGGVGNLTSPLSTPVQTLTGAQGDPSGFLTDIVYVSQGQAFSVALDSSGNVWSWGYNAYGQLGLGTTGSPNTTSYDTPQLVQLAAAGAAMPIVAVSAGSQAQTIDGQCLAIDSAGVVWAWGNNTFGQLGNGSSGTSANSVPAPVMYGGQVFKATAVSAGGQHMLAVAAAGNAAGCLPGRLYGWGSNDVGQLGLGTSLPDNTAYVTPTLIPKIASRFVNSFYAGPQGSIVDVQVSLATGGASDISHTTDSARVANIGRRVSDAATTADTARVADIGRAVTDASLTTDSAFTGHRVTDTSLTSDAAGISEIVFAHASDLSHTTDGADVARQPAHATDASATADLADVPRQVAGGTDTSHTTDTTGIHAQPAHASDTSLVSDLARMVTQSASAVDISHTTDTTTVPVQAAHATGTSTTTDSAIGIGPSTFLVHATDTQTTTDSARAPIVFAHASDLSHTTDGANAFIFFGRAIDISLTRDTAAATVVDLFSPTIVVRTQVRIFTVSAPELTLMQDVTETDPAGVVQRAAEAINWGIDVTDAVSGLPGTPAPTNPTSTFTDTVTGQPITLPHGPEIDDTDPYVIVQPIPGDLLVVNHTSELEVVYTAGNATLANVLQISCPG